MPETDLESRVQTLEQKLEQIAAQLRADRSGSRENGKSWQDSLGMFNDSSLMPVIDDEGNRIRQADRIKAVDDPA
jgi:hypothetical protein